MTDTRTEQDFLGQRALPKDALYGINTQRAMENFALGQKHTELSLIHAMVQVKKASARTYLDLGMGNPHVFSLIVSACDDILTGAFDDAFVTEALQGGAGTSAHMNVNEVIANVALKKAGHAPGDYEFLHPLDDVNLGQSTNDVYPTALRICTIQQVRQVSDACAALQEALQEKEQAWADIKKAGRTQLMNAVPITLGEEFGAYAQAIARDRWRLYKIEERLRQINLGGTAVGTGTNASRRYAWKAVEFLREQTGIGLAKAEYPMDLTQNQDVFCEVSGLLKALAVNLMKICSDMRLMNSEAYREIRLSPMQQGSTIMPSKINPVIPEMATQTAMKVIANDCAVTMAASSGNFELNPFLPLIADCLLDSLKLLSKAIPLFTSKAIRPLLADEKGCANGLRFTKALPTALARSFGYDQAARIARECDFDEARMQRYLCGHSPSGR